MTNTYNILPVVSMAANESKRQGLILLKIVLVHDGAVAVITALARVNVAVF